MHPVLFQIGSLEVRSYFVMVFLAFFIAAWMAARRAAGLGLTRGQIAVLGAVTVAAGVGGARLIFVLTHWKDYQGNLLSWFRVDDGGFGFFGGVAAALPMVAGVLALYRKPVLLVLDRMMPCVVLAVAITRIGCSLNECCYGRLAPSAWGVSLLPFEFRLRYPVQLYESGFLFLLFAALLLWEKRSRPGGVLLACGLLYGFWRFGGGFMRGEEPPVLLGWSLSQWIGLGLAAVSAAVWAVRRFVRGRR